MFGRARRQAGWREGEGLVSMDHLLVISSAVALVVCRIHPETYFAMKLEN